MDYIIRNKSGLYVKLNENGTPETCNESQRGLFECSKANNICNSLPKQLKKFNFFVEAVPEIQPKIDKQNVITINVRKAHSFRCGMDSTKNNVYVKREYYIRKRGEYYGKLYC